MTNNISTGLVSGALTRGEFGESDAADNYFENYFEQIYVRTVNLKVSNTNFAGSNLIWGNTAFGTWGSYYWGNAANASFILGHELAGLLGSNTLGTNESTPVRIQESFIWVDYVDNFDNTTYKDTTNTTGSWLGTGSVVFNRGALSTTINFTTGSYNGSEIAASSGSIQLV